MNEQRKVIMSGLLVNCEGGVINAHGIPVRSDVPLPYLGEPISVINNGTGQVFDGAVTRINQINHSYDISARVE